MVVLYRCECYQPLRRFEKDSDWMHSATLCAGRGREAFRRVAWQSLLPHDMHVPRTGCARSFGDNRRKGRSDARSFRGVRGPDGGQATYQYRAHEIIVYTCVNACVPACFCVYFCVCHVYGCPYVCRYVCMYLLARLLLACLLACLFGRLARTKIGTCVKLVRRELPLLAGAAMAGVKHAS